MSAFSLGTIFFASCLPDDKQHLNGGLYFKKDEYGMMHVAVRVQSLRGNNHDKVNWYNLERVVKILKSKDHLARIPSEEDMRMVVDTGKHINAGFLDWFWLSRELGNPNDPRDLDDYDFDIFAKSLADEGFVGEFWKCDDVEPRLTLQYVESIFMSNPTKNVSTGFVVGDPDSKAAISYMGDMMVRTNAYSKSYERINGCVVFCEAPFEPLQKPGLY